VADPNVERDSLRADHGDYTCGPTAVFTLLVSAYCPLWTTKFYVRLWPGG